MPTPALIYFMFSTMAISLPLAVLFFCWIATMWKGSMTFETPMLFAIGFIVLFGMDHRIRLKPLPRSIETNLGPQAVRPRRCNGQCSNYCLLNPTIAISNLYPSIGLVLCC